VSLEEEVEELKERSRQKWKKMWVEVELELSWMRMGRMVGGCGLKTFLWFAAVAE